MTTTATYLVEGMTCGHCEASVRSALTQLPGVSEVDVDLGTGQVTVTSADALDGETVRAAVDEAGYALVS